MLPIVLASSIATALLFLLSDIGIQSLTIIALPDYGSC